jgi:hypothetical protein
MIFAAPALLVMIEAQRRVVVPRKTRWEVEAQTFHAALLLWLVLLVLFTLLGLGSSYVCLLFCVFPLVGRVVGAWVGSSQYVRRRWPSQTGWVFVLGYITGLYVPLVMVVQLFLQVLKFFM